MTTMMTVHASPDESVAFGERYGLYRTLSEGPFTAGELAERSGLPEMQVSHWLAAQESGGYVVHGRGGGRYQNWCEIPRN
jgi:hypothetical protein